MGYRDYSTAKGHIVDATGHGDFTTISAALAAATSGQTIFVRPGTYTENPTLKAGVDLVAFITDSDIPNVIINGTCSFSSAGTTGISGIMLQTNSSFALSVTGSAASIVYLTDCYINCTNNTGIQFTSSSASSSITLTNTNGNLGTTGIAYYTHSAAGIITFEYGAYLNSGGSVTANSHSAGVVNISYAAMQNPFSLSSSAHLGGNYANLNTATQNTTTITLTGTSTAAFEYTDFISGSAIAITIGVGCTVNIISTCRIDSTNAAPITGSGTIFVSNIIYTNTSALNGTSIQNFYPSQNGSWTLLQSIVASSSASVIFANLPTNNYTKFAFVVTDLVGATNTQKLQMVTSTNNGTSYNSSGYNSGVNYNAYNAATWTNVNSTTSLFLSSNINNGAGYSGNFFYDVSQGFLWGQSTYFSTDTSTFAMAMVQGFGAAALANAFKFTMTSGNINAGRISLYGING